jgi:hypothetical protein
MGKGAAGTVCGRCGHFGADDTEPRAVVGRTGSGKNFFPAAAVSSLLAKRGPDESALILADCCRRYPGNDFVVCTLPSGHGGPHTDVGNRISWVELPDEVADRIRRG